MRNNSPIIKLDAEERAIERAIGRGEFTPVADQKKVLAEFKKAARNTTAKTKAINIRISERDLIHLRAKAMREGIPYQTYVSSLVHKAIA